jgi:hypothetical protein
MTQNWNISPVFGNRKICLHPRNFANHCQENWCTGYFGSKLWMVFTIQIHLKLIYGKLFGKDDWVLYEMLVSASRECIAAYCMCDANGTSRHQWNTCRTPTLEPRHQHMWFLGISNTYTWAARSEIQHWHWCEKIHRHYSMQEMAYCTCLRGEWGTAKKKCIRHVKAITLKNKQCPGIRNPQWVMLVFSLLFKLPSYFLHIRLLLTIQLLLPIPTVYGVWLHPLALTDNGHLFW